MKKKKSTWFLSLYTFVRPLLGLLVVSSEISQLVQYDSNTAMTFATLIDALLVGLSLKMIYKMRSKQPNTYNYVIFVIYMEFICTSASIVLRSMPTGNYGLILGSIIGVAIWDISVLFYVKSRKEFLTYDSNKYDEKVLSDEPESTSELLCGNCRKPINEDDTKCSNCGLDFKDEAQKELFVCSNCGTKIYKDLGKCPYCGENFEDNKEETKKNENKKEESTIDQKYSDLTKLKELLDKKIITKEEFEKEKKKVLK